MNYKTENGVIVNEFDEPVAMIPGTPGLVEFPSLMIWELHRSRPGYIFKLAHTHPPGMISLSSTDQSTLRTWAMALSPFPIRMSTITWDTGLGEYIESTYLAIVEPKELWEKHKGERKIDVTLESVIGLNDERLPWQQWIIERSYDD